MEWQNAEFDRWIWVLAILNSELEKMLIFLSQSNDLEVTDLRSDWKIGWKSRKNDIGR